MSLNNSTQENGNGTQAERYKQENEKVKARITQDTKGELTLYLTLNETQLSRLVLDKTKDCKSIKKIVIRKQNEKESERESRKKTKELLKSIEKLNIRIQKRKDKTKDLNSLNTVI